MRSFSRRRRQAAAAAVLLPPCQLLLIVRDRSQVLTTTGPPASLVLWVYPYSLPALLPRLARCCPLAADRVETQGRGGSPPGSGRPCGGPHAWVAGPSGGGSARGAEHCPVCGWLPGWNCCSESYARAHFPAS
jgi:hypothetical protein